MGASIEAYIQFDGNVPTDEAPFSGPPRTWDLTGDYRLGGCKDYRFFAAISGVRAEDGFTPLYPLRGLPKHAPYERISALVDDVDDCNVGWLSYGEIIKALDHARVSYSELNGYVQTVLDVMSAFARSYGSDRVRLVFSISD